ncbi:MAG: DUF2207 domain-containing protein [Xanthobacteraceae bacterium]
MIALRRAALALLVLLAGLAPATGAERILSFISDVKVLTNSDLLVTETIRIQAEGDAFKHGLLRDFPTTYTRRNGTRVRVGFDVQSVTRDGVREAFTTERKGNGVEVRIGDPDVMLSFGPHEYVIRYLTTRQIGFFPDFDELYWNATGNGWAFTIDQAEARITLPASAAFLNSAFYTGPQGADGKDATVIAQRPGYIAFRTTQPLPPHNGLTVAASWPKGVVTQPSNAQRSGSWLEDNAPLVVSALGMLIVFGYYLYAWRRAGRDPSRGTIVPLFAPPDGMSAAAVRYVRRMGFDDRTFTAAIIDLAVHGHLKLAEIDKATWLKRRTGGKPIAAPEVAAESKLFPADSTDLELKQDNHATLEKAHEALSDGLEKAYEGRLFHDHMGWSIAGAVLSLAVIALALLSTRVAQGWDAFTTFASDMVYLIVGGALLSFLVIRVYRDLARGRILALLLHVGGGLFAGILALGSIGVAAEILDDVPGWLQAAPVGLPLILFPLAVSAFYWMKAHTVAGRKITDQIEGFRQYLGVAEEARLDALNPPDKTPELFERFLPYAIALDVENHWAQRFAGVLAAAAAAGATATWYSGSHDWGHDPVGFANNLGGDLSSTIASASEAPGSSSGSGGGGFSGGGGGGGGGGGW